jgi:3-hydroxyacyl-CoA dehydrogenase
MGSGIACHFANIEVLLWTLFQENLLMPKLKGLTLESKIVRNRLVNEHLGILEIEALSYLQSEIKTN